MPDQIRQILPQQGFAAADCKSVNAVNDMKITVKTLLHAIVGKYRHSGKIWRSSAAKLASQIAAIA
jgi:hypothetical protein